MSARILIEANWAPPEVQQALRRPEYADETKGIFNLYAKEFRDDTGRPASLAWLMGYSVGNNEGYHGLDWSPHGAENPFPPDTSEHQDWQNGRLQGGEDT